MKGLLSEKNRIQHINTFPLKLKSLKQNMKS